MKDCNEDVTSEFDPEDKPQRDIKLIMTDINHSFVCENMYLIY